MKKSMIVFLLVFTNCISNAQKEGNVWYFGEFAGVDFNSGGPIAVTNGVLNTQEGCASYCDSAGNILFYTDGVSVYNRLHVAMPNGNGLNGNASSTQSAIILKRQGIANRYYIFTVGVIAATGLCYSEVDMNLAGGNGDVINKNTSVIPGTLTEKLTAVYHANGSDFWVAVHGNNNNMFSAVLVDAAGVNMTPVVSNVGSNHTAAVGYMKFSPDGSKLAAALYGSSQIDILDFDNATGVFTNPLTYNVPAPVPFSSYGLEFSPNGSRLYFSNESNVTMNIVQLNMDAGSPAAILASATIVLTDAAYSGAMSLAPDGKVYFNRYLTNWLGVINYPDSLGLACSASDSGVFLGSGVSRIGLPNFYSGIYTSAFSFVNTCLGDTTFFSSPNTFGVLGKSWNFDDIASGINNTSFVSNPYHIFTAAGTYMVQLINYYSTTSDTIILPVTINTIPVFSLGVDTVICTGATLLLSPGSGFSAYLWQDGSLDSTFLATVSGNYYVTVSNGACSATDSITVNTTSCAQPNVALASSDTSFCGKQCLDFFDLSTNNPTSWQWYFPGADSTTSNLQNPTNICYNSYGSFNVTLIACNAAGCDSLVLINFINEYQSPPVPVVTSNPDTLFSSPAFSYQWYNIGGPIVGAINQSYIYTQPGSYYVVITDSNGCASSSNIITTGIFDYSDLENSYVVYANPFTNMLNISFSNSSILPATLYLYNVQGQLLHEQNLDGKHMEIDLSINNYLPGLYLLKLQSLKLTRVHKFIINQ